MDIAHIRKLLQSPQLPDPQLIETHISWVILAGTYAYKIKKPVKFSFLDFSTVDLRQHYCLREIELNRRFSSDIYVDVVPIYQSGEAIRIEKGMGEIIDYAVRMRRVAQEYQMDRMLRDGKVLPKHMEQVAAQLARFHQTTTKAPSPPDPDMMLADFSDLTQYMEILRSRYRHDGMHSVMEAMIIVKDFLHRHAQRIQERYRDGFVVDGHGDLHSKNIFLLDKPVIFDCIEFNDHLRYVDVLDELAFFCIDLELYERDDLAADFLKQYVKLYPCLITNADLLLFQYFKLYRAGVKFKINLIKATDPAQSAHHPTRWDLADKYFGLFKRYLLQLKKSTMQDGSSREKDSP